MKLVDIMSFTISIPFMIIGYLVSVIRFGFEIGYEFNSLGEFRTSSIASLLKTIEKLNTKG